MKEKQTLAEYLQELRINEIEDDQEFCDAEHDAIQDYCEAHGYGLSEEDMREIRSRGEEETFLIGKEWNEA